MWDWLKSIRRAQQQWTADLVEACLSDYTPYLTPEWDSDEKTLDVANAEYVAFFMASRAERLSELGKFLARFDVSLGLDEDGAAAVSRWLPAHADGLLRNVERDSARNAFLGLDVPWVGPLVGLNAVFDLAIYFGECLIERNPNLQWQPIRGRRSGVTSHWIVGYRSRKPFEPMESMFWTINNIIVEKRFGGIVQSHLQPDFLVRDIEANSRR